MKYYAMGQDKTKNGIFTGMNSVDFELLETEDIMPVKVYQADGGVTPNFDDSCPEYGDIISGVTSVYSDRICEVIEELDLPVTIVPSKITILNPYEPAKESTGYNLVLGVPDVNCMKAGIDIDKGFVIDEAIAEGNALFDMEYDSYKGVRVVSETTKERFEKMNLAGVYFKPIEELTPGIVFHLQA